MEQILTEVRAALLRGVDGEHTDEVLKDMIDRQAREIMKLLQYIVSDVDRYHLLVGFLNNLRLASEVNVEQREEKGGDEP